MIRFTVDPSFVADALEQGRTLVVQVNPVLRTHRVVLGPPMSPPKREAAALAKRKSAA